MKLLPWAPVFNPQMTGGTGPPGLVKKNWSSLHCVIVVMVLEAAANAGKIINK